MVDLFSKSFQVDYTDKDFEEFVNVYKASKVEKDLVFEFNFSSI